MSAPIPFLNKRERFNGWCPFCKRIDKGDFDSWVSDTVTFEPLNPVVPGHRLFVPVEHVMNADEDPIVTGQTFEFAARWADQQGGAYNLITSAGAAATQTVFHLHVHYVPRREGDGLTLPWTGQTT
jgi:histidine triad (HIT) family protein